ncbi:MAG: asparagine--tRNA ligase [Myxococcales bacterium]|nr:asparagine--tRNA ligase [Myxococcales bacterium]USN51480.1 MAG: asparagine--tRNA ligase [Myxococcales bacterium]
MTETNLQPPHVTISTIANYADQRVTLKGWLYNQRGSGKLLFLHIRDGSGFIQGILAKADVSEEMFEEAKKLGQEASIIVSGVVKQEPRAPYCGYELHLDEVKLVAESHNYPIAKKAHGDAFLMDHRHLWLRSRRQHAILRIRATIIKAARDYLDSHGFLLVDSPIFTPNACEGTSTLFETKWFDDSKAFLSQSGQLYQEAAAMAFGKTYCFGPTFRAEKSKTRRHLNEFWMVEPEAAYMDLEGDINLAEDFLCFIVEQVLNKHEHELTEVLERDIAPLKKIQKPFVRLSYCDAVKMIREIQTQTQDTDLKNLLDIQWGMDFGSPHETELTKRFEKPVVVHGFPAAVKAFYMKKDEQNPSIARCMDILAPEGYGEIIGGGQREDNLDLLMKEIERHKLNQADFEWFLDLRRYGSVPHAGFGLGIERTVAWLCGLHHVRETIPFARTLDRLYP